MMFDIYHDARPIYNGKVEIDSLLTIGRRRERTCRLRYGHHQCLDLPNGWAVKERQLQATSNFSIFDLY